MNTINSIMYERYRNHRHYHAIFIDKFTNFQIINARLGQLEFNWMDIKRELR